MAAVGLASAALFYLLREHWAHVFGMLPYLLFFACPVMHFFMHGKHGHGHHRDPEGANVAADPSPTGAVTRKKTS
jgi:Protein of unknown function (DUF2933)